MFPSVSIECAVPRSNEEEPDGEIAHAGAVLYRW